MSLEVIRPGLLTTLQDAGRTGYAALGIHPTGAMDQEALFLANALVGNPDNTAAIEMHFPAAEFRFHQDAIIAVTGANWEPHINQKPISINQTILIKAGAVFSCRRPMQGARCYLGIAGGMNIPAWLGSYSTDLAAQAGGWMGRSLKFGDIIPFCKNIRLDTTTDFIGPIKPALSKPSSEKITLLPGPEFNWLGEEKYVQLFEQEFTISPNSNRMGIRLKGKQPLITKTETMISTAVLFGTIQLLPNGELIVLMADHPTTGGYPRIAHLPYFEKSVMAQKNTGENVRFTLNESLENIYMQNERYIKAESEFRSGIRVKVQSYLEQHVTER